jgi:hypothetical protein
MPDSLLIALLLLFGAAIGALAVALPPRRAAQPRALLTRSGAGASVGIGTVRTVTHASRAIVVDVESVSGQRFVGRLRRSADTAVSTLRPGAVVLVTFDPAVREQLSLADDIAAVSAEFDRMLIGKGLLTNDKLDLIRHGVRSRGVVTGMRTTGTQREDHREVEIDLMVRRPGGGQFPAHERTLVPASSLAEVKPGCVIDAYYRRDDETVVAVCVPPR